MIADIGRIICIWIAFAFSYLVSFDYVKFLNQADKLVSVAVGLVAFLYTTMKIIEMVTNVQIFPGNDND